jgi:hypothetical protein
VTHRADPEQRALWQRDGFRRDVGHAAMPLAIWAVHFFACYVFVAVGCRWGLADRTILAVPVLSAGLGVLTAIALVFLARIVVKAAGGRRAVAGSTAIAGGLRAVRFGIAILSLVAVAWTVPPIVLFTSCLQ